MLCDQVVCTAICKPQPVLLLTYKHTHAHPLSGACTYWLPLQSEILEGPYLEAVAYFAADNMVGLGVGVISGAGLQEPCAPDAPATAALQPGFVVGIL
jgi:hypothetical protein